MELDNAIEEEVRTLAKTYCSYREMRIKGEGLAETEDFHRQRIMQVCIAEDYDFKPYIALYDELIRK